MARCEDCLHYKPCLDTETRHLKIILLGDKAERCKHFIPTADVVPKSEVDKTIAEFAYLHADALNKLDNAKAEVAREIFAEIDKHLIPKNQPFVEMDYIKFLDIRDKYIPKNCRTCKHMLSCEPNVFGICDGYEEGEK